MTLTPMMQQYRDAKAAHPGTLLLFRMGDFYELFEEDAHTAARVLQLTLTSRDKQIPMAGFPHHALDNHLHKLLEAGHRVAICEQTEDPAQAKGLVKREVIRVVTAGTLTEDSLLDPKEANYLAAVLPVGQKAALAWVELTLGTFQAVELPLTRLADELVRLNIAECLWPENQPADILYPVKTVLPQLGITPRAPWQFDRRTAKETLHKHFQVQTMQGFGFEDDALPLQAAGALLLYLQETLKCSLAHLTKLEPYQTSNVMVLDNVTRRGLELCRTLREGRREGSVLASIDRTVTAMGARLLQEWLLAPLMDLHRINARLDAVAELKAQHHLREKLQECLRQMPDVPRLTTRASTGRASPRDLAAVNVALSIIPALRDLLTYHTQSKLLNELLAQLDPCPEIHETLTKALVDGPPLSPKEGGLIRPSFHAELDELRDISRGGKEWIARFQAQEIARTGINSLKVGFNQVFGYYIEITHTHASKVPADYQRKQTLKNAERYITPELKTYEDKVLRAEEQSQALEYEIFLQLREQVAAAAPCLLTTAQALAQLDVLTGLADLADRWHYGRPHLTHEAVCIVKQARHPVLDQTLPPGTFVPNDANFGPEGGMVWLITGPNMAGKSTYIRQVALLSVLAQMGSFLPAVEATLGLVDRIFTRIGAGDDLARGQSTFMVEMAETANLLNNATPRSLVILDEVGRGTSTYDGLALAWAIVEHLHDQIGCRTLFATHYHELTQLASSLPRLRNYNAAVEDREGQITFLHRIVFGPADQSYGVHVAQLAGVPTRVIARAQQVLRQLEQQHSTGPLAAEVTSQRRRRGMGREQPNLFGE
jgi:DNA mismatch repair protein MutS